MNAKTPKSVVITQSALTSMAGMIASVSLDMKLISTTRNALISMNVRMEKTNAVITLIATILLVLIPVSVSTATSAMVLGARIKMNALMITIVTSMPYVKTS